MATTLTVDDIPVAHTPEGGYDRETPPPPILAGCDDPLAPLSPSRRPEWNTSEQ
jgi:hypothetical protein